MHMLLALLLSLPAAADVGIRTDLGREGNRYVVRTFEAYRALHPEGACRAEGPGRRVLVAGYGLFSGVPYNISGAVVRSMADPGFWPEQVRLNSPVAWRGAPSAASLSPADRGGRAYVRSLTIDGRRYEACFLVLDVIWDLAAAILVHETARFKPAAIVMTGRGGGEAEFEGGAINRASPYPGYDSSGRPLDTVNTPVSEWLVPDYAVGHQLPMRWDSRRLAEANMADAKALGYRTVGHAEARSGNDYLCNDIAFMALHAASGRSSSFANGDLVLAAPELPEPPAVGFLHFPAADQRHPRLQDYGAGVAGWAKIVSRAIALTAPLPLARY